MKIGASFKEAIRSARSTDQKGSHAVAEAADAVLMVETRVVIGAITKQQLLYRFV